METTDVVFIYSNLKYSYFLICVKFAYTDIREYFCVDYLRNKNSITNGDPTIKRP